MSISVFVDAISGFIKMIKFVSLAIPHAWNA